MSSFSKLLNPLSIFTALCALFAPQAFAQDSLPPLETIGKPIEAGIGLQPSVTELARDILWFDNFLLVLITAIWMLVVGLMAFIIFRFSRKRNPTPATFSHNTPLETIWTVIPVIILVVIAFISIPALIKQQRIPKADINIKVVGYQWYWGYEYTDEDISFESYMLQRDQLSEYGYNDDEYLLATDTAVIIPVNKTVVMQVTANDVIHSWTIPAFGVKQDAVPGRTAELWFKAEKEGVYFGQCSELCGINHSYMPITVKVVSQSVYDNWLAETKANASLKPTQSPVIASRP